MLTQLLKFGRREFSNNGNRSQLFKSLVLTFRTQDGNDPAFPKFPLGHASPSLHSHSKVRGELSSLCNNDFSYWPKILPGHLPFLARYIPAHGLIRSPSSV